MPTALEAGKTTDTAYRCVKGRVIHAHFSIPDDTEAMKSLERQFELLLYDGFDGAFSLEIIKKGDNTDQLIKHAQMVEKDEGKIQCLMLKKINDETNTTKRIY